MYSPIDVCIILHSRSIKKRRGLLSQKTLSWFGGWQQGNKKAACAAFLLLRLLINPDASEKARFS
jgi:hypothetical protein